MKTVFYQDTLENLILKKEDHIYIPLSQYDGNAEALKAMIRLLKEENIKEIFIIDECEVFDPVIKEEYFIITDHINATGDNPLIGQNDDKIGERFPDMTFAYSDKLNNELKSHFIKNNISFKESVLFGSTEKPQDQTEIKNLIKVNCHISGFNIMWIDIIARHAGIEVGAVAVKK